MLINTQPQIKLVYKTILSALGPVVRLQ